MHSGSVKYCEQIEMLRLTFENKYIGFTASLDRAMA
jgi:hypothetical protein